MPMLGLGSRVNQNIIKLPVGGSPLGFEPDLICPAHFFMSESTSQFQNFNGGAEGGSQASRNPDDVLDSGILSKDANLKAVVVIADLNGVTTDIDYYVHEIVTGEIGDTFTVPALTTGEHILLGTVAIDASTWFYFGVDYGEVPSLAKWDNNGVWFCLENR